MAQAGRVAGNLDQAGILQHEAVAVHLDVPEEKQFAEGVELVLTHERMVPGSQQQVLVPGRPLPPADALLRQQGTQNSFQAGIEVLKQFAQSDCLVRSTGGLVEQVADERQGPEEIVAFLAQVVSFRAHRCVLRGPG